MEICFTWKNSAGFSRHVNLVPSCNAQHHRFWASVVLGGQQPAERFGKNPVAIANMRKTPMMSKVTFLQIALLRCVRCPEKDFLVNSPHVGQHQHERTDDDNLQDLPVVSVRPVAAQSGHAGHQELPCDHQETGHHGHGETPGGQAKLNP